ncbi:MULTISPECIES: hypothetical protein [Phenylobacterium]|uniref:Uncharacterized protein n=1 Tax=Phenylobacterium koreense TaxID=266125 RepID=A0ABV2EI14_9CAUL
MSFLQRIFGAIDRRFLARSYVISFAIAGLLMWVRSRSETGDVADATAFYVFVTLNAALFPFAKLVWNELRDFLMGDNFILANAILVFGAKFIVNVMLWGCALFIAPVGVAYLWFRTRSA